LNGHYLVLAGRVRSELDEIAAVAGRAGAIWDAATGGVGDYHVDAVALNLHGFYAGVERLMEAIADTVDRSKPAGANGRQELLRQMASEVPGVRPAVFSVATRNLLDRYRGFRHVVRNVYSFELDPHLVDALIRQLPDVFAAARSDLLAFADFLESCGNG
jgi:hypothetical protein